MKKKINQFAQGYLCCIAKMIESEGGVTTMIEELYIAGGYRLSEMKNIGIDEYDIDLFRKYNSELERKHH